MVAFLGIIYLVLITMAVISGAKGADAWSMRVDINTFKTNTFILGIDNHEECNFNYRVYVLTIGFVIVNITVEFFKFGDLSEEDLEEIKNALEDLHKKPGPNIEN